MGAFHVFKILHMVPNRAKRYIWDFTLIDQFLNATTESYWKIDVEINYLPGTNSLTRVLLEFSIRCEAETTSQYLTWKKF